MQWLKRLFTGLFKPKVPEPLPYSSVTPHLAQGDIFSLHLVAPLADDEIRILRTKAGLHGANVFAGDPGHIFDYGHLIETISKLPPDKQFQPFHNQGGLPLEKVVVFGDLVEYFMVASQTCDVSGVDSKPKIFAAIVPVVPLAAFLSRQRIPIGLEKGDIEDESKWTTIVDYLEMQLKVDVSDMRDDSFALPAKIRELLKDWNPKKNTPEKQIRGKIRGILNEVVKPQKKYLYYLPANSAYGVPEGFVDFTRLYSVVTEKLQKLTPRRVCTLVTPYREEFASKLGSYLSRIATPAPLTPPDI